MNMAVKAGAPPRDYADLHDLIRTLDDAGLLITVDIPINKDTELHPLVRWQFRGGLPADERKVWLFTNLTDAKGKKYDMPVLVGFLGSSPRVYSTGLGCSIEDSIDLWARALAEPIPPRVVDDAPCQEVVIEGEALDVPGQGLDGLPVPNSTPGWDNAPYLTALGYLTRDPETGVQNLGCYRAQVKAPRRLGMNTSTENRSGGYQHWLKYRERGEKMPCAYIIGGPPSVAYTGIWKMPEDQDELAVAGGLVGAPINVVRARTVDLLVPAEAEIVVEGFVDTEYLEPEAPFGESHGYVNPQEYNAVMEVTAITRRKDAVFTSYLSQLHPNETTSIRAVVQEVNYLEFLRGHLGIRGVIRVATHQPLTGNRRVLFVVLERDVPRTEVWRALYGMISQQASTGKIIIAVNDDIDPKNLDAVMWAMAFRASPHLDFEIVKHRVPGHGPSGAVQGGEDSALLVDATLKRDYPPIALPKREYMERAKDIWENQLGLGKIIPEAPWFGYALGDWPEELTREAERAVAGDYWETGRLQAQRRRNDVAMNTEVRDVPDPPGETSK
jgi:4-hydroxy-3-polyprenylbenzoate decarboxylase